jgi:hypothetical protein
MRRRREGHSVRAVASQQQVVPAPPRRNGGPSQDRALYKCGCGYMFEAAVSTSVGCPHCGGTQAW